MSSDSNILLLITAENKAGQVLNQVQDQAVKTQENIEKASQKTRQTTERLNVNMLQAASSFAAVGAGVAGFVTSLDTLEKAQLKVDVAQKRVNDLMNQGKEGTEEFRIAQERLRLAQDGLSDTYVNFVAGIAPQVFSTIFGLQGAFRALGITSISQLIPAIHGVGTALKTTFITNPVGIAILAITTVIGLLVFNVGGLRDRIVELGNQILAFLDAHLKPLADAIRFIIDLFRPLADIFGVVMPEQMGNMQDAVTDLEGVTLPSFERMEQETVDLGTAIGTTMDQINTELEKTSKGVEATIARNIENFDKMGRTARTMSDDVTFSISEVADVTEVQSSRIVLASKAIGQVLEDIRSLSGLSGKLRQEESDAIRAGKSGGKISALFEERRGIEDEIGRLTRMGQSLALAGGLSGFDVFGGGIRGQSGAIFGSGLFQAVTPGGTLVSKLGGSTLDIGSTRVLSNARAILERGFVNRATDIIRAQHGFEATVNKPTFLPLLVGEGGVREHVKVGPVGHGSMKLVVQFQDSVGNDLGSETLDMANREAVIRIKTRGVRMI